MTETADIQSITIEHLRHIRNRVDQIGDDFSDLRLRFGSLESSMTMLRREINYRDEVDNRQQASIDKLLDRIEKLERVIEAK
jgi:hypothetical protein